VFVGENANALRQLFFFSFFAWLSSEDFLLASLIERKDFL